MKIKELISVIQIVGKNPMTRTFKNIVGPKNKPVRARWAENFYKYREKQAILGRSFSFRERIDRNYIESQRIKISHILDSEDFPSADSFGICKFVGSKPKLFTEPFRRWLMKVGC